MKNWLKYSLLSLVLFSLVVPQISLAFVGTGIFDFFDTALGGIEETAGPITAELVRTFLIYVAGLITLYLSANFLQTILDNPQWLKLGSSPMVLSGWRFIVGVADIFLILILVVIAFAYILKIETFEAKKTLPRLIIIALLMNFSLIFVQIFVDISTIIYQTILTGNTGLPFKIIEQLGVGGYSVLLSLITWLASIAITSIIPFTAPFAQLALVLGVVGIIFLPNLLIWYIQIILFFMVSGIFFLYVLLLAARIFIIQLLAILSPLAFLCYILPQTKKYWDEWLNHLVQWVFFGIAVLFFFVIGVKAATSLAPPGATLVPAPGIGWIFTFFGGGASFVDYFIYYFFLVIYFAVVLWLVTRNMPTIATAIIGTAAAVGGMAYATGLKPLGIAARKQAEAAAVAQQKTEADAKRIGRPLTARERLTGTLATGMRWSYRRFGTTPEAGVGQRIEKTASQIEATHGKEIESAIPVYGKAGGEQLVALGRYATKIGKVDKLPPELQKRIANTMVDLSSDKDVKDFVKFNPDLIDDENIGQKIQQKIVSKGTQDKDVQELINAGVDQVSAIREVTYKKAAQALKNENIPDISDDSWTNNKFKEAIIKYQGSGFIRRVGEEKGSTYIEALHDTADEIGVEELAKTNSTLVRQSIRNPGFRAVFGPVIIKETKQPLTKDEDLDVILAKIKGARDLREKGIERPPITKPPEEKKDYDGSKGPGKGDYGDRGLKGGGSGSRGPGEIPYRSGKGEGLLDILAKEEEEEQARLRRSLGLPDKKEEEEGRGSK